MHPIYPPKVSGAWGGIAKPPRGAMALMIGFWPESWMYPGMEVKLTFKKGRNSHISKWRVLLSDYRPGKFICEDADLRGWLRGW